MSLPLAAYSFPSILPVQTWWTGLPAGSTPSTVIMTSSPFSAYTTVVFLCAPVGIFDFDSLSFHVPIKTLSPAKERLAVRAEMRSASKVVLVFMANIQGLAQSIRQLLNQGKFSLGRAFRQLVLREACYDSDFVSNINRMN